MLFSDVVRSSSVGPLIVSALVLAAYLGAAWAMLGQLVGQAPAI